MALGTEIDEGGLETGLDTRNAATVDVGFFLFPSTGFDVEVVQALSIDECDAQLFGLCRIDEHSFHASLTD